MSKWNAALITTTLTSTLAVLAACVTINVYFPAAAAERAAEQFIEDVLAEPPKEGALFEPARPVDKTWSLASLLPPAAEGGCARQHATSARPLSCRSLRSTYPTGVGGSPAAPVWLLAQAVLDFLVPSAQAQQAELDINTPQINAIKARMAERQQRSLAALFDAGAIGFTADGLVTIRDRSAVSLSERRNLETVVADENRDRKAVYREIAVANGHPEWEQEIQQTFAREWVRNARPGWYYQEANGAWRQK